MQSGCQPAQDLNSFANAALRSEVYKLEGLVLPCLTLALSTNSLEAQCPSLDELFVERALVCGNPLTYQGRDHFI